MATTLAIMAPNNSNKPIASANKASFQWKGRAISIYDAVMLSYIQTIFWTSLAFAAATIFSGYMLPLSFAAFVICEKVGYIVTIVWLFTTLLMVVDSCCFKKNRMAIVTAFQHAEAITLSCKEADRLSLLSHHYDEISNGIHINPNLLTKMIQAYPNLDLLELYSRTCSVEMMMCFVQHGLDIMKMAKTMLDDSQDYVFSMIIKRSNDKEKVLRYLITTKRLTPEALETKEGKRVLDEREIIHRYEKLFLALRSDTGYPLEALRLLENSGFFNQYSASILVTDGIYGIEEEYKVVQ